MGWSQLENGALLDAAERLFDALVTTDRSLEGRRLSVLVLPTTSWRSIERHRNLVQKAIDRLRPGDFVELQPFTPGRRPVP
jgi:hypothetical protein